MVVDQTSPMVLHTGNSPGLVRSFFLITQIQSESTTTKLRKGTWGLVVHGDCLNKYPWSNLLYHLNGLPEFVQKSK